MSSIKVLAENIEVIKDIANWQGFASLEKVNNHNVLQVSKDLVGEDRATGPCEPCGDSHSIVEEGKVYARLCRRMPRRWRNLEGVLAVMYLCPFHGLQSSGEIKVKLCQPMAPPNHLEHIASH